MEISKLRFGPGPVASIMSFLGTINARTRNTFKPKKSIQEGSKVSQLKRYATAVLGSGNLKQAVILPEGEDLNEWLAVNTVDFFNQVNMLYSTVTEFCSPTACPTMSAGQRYEYLWADPPNAKSSSQRTEPLKMSAPEYVDTLMSYIQSRIDDEATFPSKIGAPFPKQFGNVVRTIWRRLFRVYAHVYCEHFSVIVGLGLESHLNTSFKHFVLFAKEFEYFRVLNVLNNRLIENKDFAPLAELVDSMLEQEE